MNGKRVQKKTEWTAEDRERRRKVRELIKDKPTIEQLVTRGELSGSTVPMGLYLEIQQLLHDLKQARAAAGLSLADLAERTGMDKAVLSKMENGQHGIPTLPSLARYAQAVGLHLAIALTPATEQQEGPAEL
jgi:ribosome-binding protein aMBF1 (putative translation factor)